MVRRRPSKTDPRCSFCGRTASQVDKIITGPSVHICNECVKLCNEVLAEDKKQTLPWETGTVPPKPTEIKIEGPNKQEVGQTAAEIRKYRPPEPYKGKGIRIAGEYVRRKEGKKK